MFLCEGNNSMLRLLTGVVMVLAISMGIAATPPIMIVGSGESHAMVDACDCEHEPGGGVTRRSTLLQQLRNQSNILLFDAGGFSGGGIYDDYTVGRAGDSLRTVQMIAAMGAMRYDAVAVGDDDLQYGAAWLADQAEAAHLPLVCANCTTSGGEFLFKRYITLKRNGVTFGITAVCTQEQLFPRDTLVLVSDPVGALREVWKEVCRNSDVQIIISHNGQESAGALAAAFPECDLIVNGHRKTGSEPLVSTENIPVLQFGFQGKSLAALPMKLKKGRPVFSGALWHDVLPDLAEDPAVRALIDSVARVPAASLNTFDLYIMSQCPYGLDALRAFTETLPAMPGLHFDVWFIGTVDNDTSFKSLHGDAEVNDEMVWLAVKHLYPELWLPFCTVRSRRSGDSRTLAAELGADVKKIEAWIASSGKAALQKQYVRTMRQSIDASPTLLVNNRPFGRNITPVNLLRFMCAGDTSSPALCDSLPECSEPADCRKTGYHGTCSDKGVCVYTEAVRFEFTVVTADSTLQHPEKAVVATTEELFPGAAVVTHTLSSSKGKQLIHQQKPVVLPLYLFGAAVKKDPNFGRIEEGVVTTTGGYTFKKGVVPSNYHLKRERKPGSLQLFIDPVFKGTATILRSILSDTLYARRLSIEPVFYAEPQRGFPGGEELLRQEESHRWLLLGSISQNILRQYLSRYSENPGSSWWMRRLQGSSLTAETLAAMAEADTLLLEKQWNTLEQIRSREPVVLLKDNVESIAISGERELRRLLSGIAER